ncbi:MAG: 5-formyltetrahydrofolate cyclo-ligase [Merismopedia sp. SIO2A8]|nr:5-formyltetrahydrofolate cyclo-ligase [Merismopedia sp. SIO2A8]
MSAVTCQQKSEAICHHLAHSTWVKSARTILAYTSFRNEPDLMPLIQSSTDGMTFQPKPIWGLPRCQGRLMTWHSWHPVYSPPLQSGAYGILEPAADTPTIDSDRLTPQDVILVPAVGCDRQGYRIGYGGGFYDRMLSLVPWSTLFTIGIVFDCSLKERLPIDPWDQPLMAICTESGIWSVK